MNLPEYVRAYHDAGYTVAALAPGKKQPWRGVRPSVIRSRPQTAEDLAGIFAGKPGANVGVLTGACSDDLAVLDVDSAAAWAELSRYPVFRRLKAVSAVVPTRRGFHLYMRLPWPAKGAKLEAFRADFKAEGGYVVAPPSEVRREGCRNQLYLWSGDGFRPAYAPTAGELADLVDLFGIRPVFDVAPGTEPDLSADLTGAFYGLGRTAWEALRNPKEQADRSAAEQRAILRAAAIGFTLADVRELFARHAAPGTKYRDKVQEGCADTWLEGSYLAAVDHATRTMTPYMGTVNAALRALGGQGSPFRGRGGWQATTVYIVILQAVREAGREWIRASARSMGERSGVDSMRYLAALDRLQIAGALHVRKAPEGLHVHPDPAFLADLFISNRYSLTHSLRGSPEGSGLPSEGIGYTPPPEAVAPPTFRRSTHDAHRYRALGPFGPALVDAINARKGEPFTRADLAATGIAALTLWRKLELLARAGIVETAGTRKADKAGRKATLYRAPRIGWAELDRVAAVAGTAGAGERQKKRHEAERNADRKRTE